MNPNNRRALLFLGVGVIAAIAAGAVVYALAMSVGRGAPTASAPSQLTPVPGRVVVVAAHDLQAASVVTTADVLTATYPSDLVPLDAFTSTLQVISQTARQPIAAGFPLLKREFAAGPGGQVTGPTSATIDKGKVLVAFPSTDILNSTGAVQPGDFVDILLSLPISGTTRLDASSTAGSQVAGTGKTLVAQTTLQNIRVQGTGLWTPPGQAQSNQQAGNLKIITFEVDHQQALILKFVKDSGGTIDLAVRSDKETEEVATDAVNIDYLVDLYKFIGLPKPKP